jgi:hypothetical protein
MKGSAFLGLMQCRELKQPRSFKTSCSAYVEKQLFILD